MTLQERVIVTAYTGISMVQGDELTYFYEYAEKLLGVGLMTHDFASFEVWRALKERSSDDFLSLCRPEEEPT